MSAEVKGVEVEVEVRHRDVRVVHLRANGGDGPACGAAKLGAHASCPAVATPYFGGGYCRGCGTPMCPMCLFELGLA